MSFGMRAANQREFEPVEAAMQQLLKDAPAVAVAAVKQGEVVYSHAVGDVGGTPISTDGTLFMVASISKTINGVLCMQLQESGHLSLDEDVSTYVGERVRNPHFPEIPITARHLLLHTSSLKDSEAAVNRVGEWKTRGSDCGVGLEEYVRRRLLTSGDVWSRMRAPGLPPEGGGYHYSNAGATLLGWVLEKAAGMPYAELAQARVFRPLGMAHSRHSLLEAQQLEGATLAVPHRCVGVPVGQYGVAEVPAAGLRSTALDLARLLAALTSQDARLLTPGSIREMLPDSGRQGLGWWGRDFPYGELMSKEPVFTHGGCMEGVRTHIYIWPRQRAGAVVLTNCQCGYERVAAALKRVVLADDRL